MLGYVIKDLIIQYTQAQTLNRLTPIKIKKARDVVANLTLKAMYKHKYNTTNIGGEVKVFTTGKGYYTSRKETVSRWSPENYTVKEIGRDIKLNDYDVL